MKLMDQYNVSCLPTGPDMPLCGAFWMLYCVFDISQLFN